MTTPFSLLRLPLLASLVVFESATIYELSVISILSNRAKQLIKTVSKRRKFALDLLLSDGSVSKPRKFRNADHNGLTLSNNDQAFSIYFLSSTYQCHSTTTLKITGESELVPANFVGLDLSTYWRDFNQGMSFLIRHFASVFKITCVDIKYHRKDQKVMGATNDLLSSLKLKVRDYTDSVHQYTFENAIWSAETIRIKIPNMRHKDLVTLFKLWKAGRAPTEIHLKELSTLMNLRPLAALVPGTEVHTTETNMRLRFKRDDGRIGIVEARRYQVDFRVEEA